MCNEDIIVGNKYNYKLQGHDFKVLALENTDNNIWLVEYFDGGRQIKVCACDLQEIDDCNFLD
jgi:hypothetical protein